MAYTTIDDPTAHFQSEAFTTPGGASSTTFDGNSDLQPDMIWAKQRNAANGHELWDSTRGVNSTVFPDNTSAEDTAANRITAFNSDGFSWGNAGNLNTAGDFVAWAWKANGGTTATNTDGSENSTVQANTDAGFSIVEITGTGSNATYGHGLGVKPLVYLVKRTSATGNWVWATSAYDGTHDYFYLNSTAAIQGLGYDQPTTSVFQYNDTLGATNIVYCFAEKQGFSKFGSYVGNGNTDGPFVYLGFKPAFILIKSTSSRAWYLYDHKRDGYNSSGTEGNSYLQAQDTDAESSNNTVDILSNGLKVTQTTSTQFNGNGEAYTYSAIAENPFVTSTRIPTTARQSGTI